MSRTLLTIARRIFLLVVFTPLRLPAAETTGAPTIHLIGDSTMANKKNPNFPERGWGQLFAEFIVPSAKLDNRALNGRSTATFIRERHWAALLKSLQPGDWVIIQFGHNDQKADKPQQYAAADGAYRENLKRFIAETREKQAHPVLATSVVRRKWENGKFVDTLGDYPAATRAVAAEEKVPLLELHDLTLELESGAGVEGSRSYHFPGDDTHYSENGARQVSSLAAAEIHRLKLPLMKWVAMQPVPKENPPAGR